MVVDRELITGQQSMSAPEFGDVLVAKLRDSTLPLCGYTGACARDTEPFASHGEDLRCLRRQDRHIEKHAPH